MIQLNHEYLAYRAASFLSRMLPRPLSYWFGLRVADRFYARDAEDRAAVASNLRRIYEARGTIPSDDVLEGVARKTFQYFGKYLVDFFRFHRLSEKDINKLVSFEHPEYLEECFQKGRGVILLTGHLGNWELGGAVIAAMGYPVNAVFLPQRLRKVDQFFRDHRRKRGIRGIPLGRAASGILRCLRNGEIVALLADRDFTTRDDRVEFLGRPARLPRGPAAVSIRTGAPILPAFLLRQVDDTFLCKLYRPIYPGEAGSVENIRKQICKILEEEIAMNPHQWFIFEDFWADADRAMVTKTGM